MISPGKSALTAGHVAVPYRKCPSHCLHEFPMAGSSSDSSVIIFLRLPRPVGTQWHNEEKLGFHSGVTVGEFHPVSLFSRGMNRGHRTI